MGETSKVSGSVLTASALCVGVGIALALTGCTNDDRAAESTDTTTSVVDTPAEPQVECSSGWSRDFGPARPGTAEAMVPDTPLFAEVCRYDVPARGDGPPTPPPLTASGRIDGAELATVVDSFNAADGPVNPRRCGGPDGGGPATFVWTTFHYAEGLPVHVGWSGPCNQSRNGTKSAEGLASQIPPYWTDPELR